jgi:hypothetical protein
MLPALGRSVVEGKDIPSMNIVILDRLVSNLRTVD